MPGAPDITKVSDGASRTVTYASCSPMADIWMRQGHGDHTITFDTMSQREAAVAFEATARANGFRIQELEAPLESQESAR